MSEFLSNEKLLSIKCTFKTEVRNFTIPWFKILYKKQQKFLRIKDISILRTKMITHIYGTSTT